MTVGEAVASIELEHLSKRFGDNVVLDDVSLTVEPGSVTALIGPSGAGKSTFLRCINLLERPDSGAIRVGGHVIEPGKEVRAKDLSALRRTVGMVFQSFNLFPHMTVLENVSFPQRKVLGRSKDEADARSMKLLERVGLPERPRSTRNGARAVSSSASPSPAPWPSTPASCCSTSPRRRSIPRSGSRCWPSCASSPTTA